MIIRDAQAADAAQLAAIYNHYVRHTLITFEEEELSPSDFADRISKIQANYPFIVAVENDCVIAFAYANKWRERSAYRYTLESSVYVHPDHFGKSAGSKLYEHLLARLKAEGLKNVMGVITLPNDISVRMHERFGFVKAAHFAKVGLKFGEWCDVGFWQKEL